MPEKEMSTVARPAFSTYSLTVCALLTAMSVVLARVRERALAGGDDSLAYFEWSADVDGNPEEVTEEMAADRSLWAQANPALGIRISPEHVEREARSMGSREFAVERHSGSVCIDRLFDGGGEREIPLFGLPNLAKSLDGFCGCVDDELFR